MVIQLPQYQRTYSQPQVNPTVPTFAGQAAYGRAQQNLIATIFESVGNVATEVYGDYKSRVADQFNTATTAYKAEMSNYLKEIESNPRTVSMNGNEDVNDPLGNGYVYSNVDAYMEAKRKAEEKVSGLVGIPAAQRAVSEAIKEIDQIYLSGVQQFDKQKNSEARINRLMDSIDLAVGYNDVTQVKNLMTVAYKSGLIKDQGIAQSILESASERIGYENKLEILKGFANSEGIEKALNQIQNPETAPAGVFMFDVLKIGEDGEVYSEKKSLSPEMMGELATAVASDYNATQKKIDAMYKQASEDVRIDIWNRIKVDDISDGESFIKAISDADEYIMGKVGKPLSSTDREWLSNRFDEHINGKRPDDKVKSAAYRKHLESYFNRAIGEDVWRDQISNARDLTQDEKVDLLGMASGKKANTYPIITDTYEAMQRRGKQKIEEAYEEDELLGILTEQAFNMNMMRFGQVTAALSEQYPNQVDFVRAFQDLASSDMFGDRAEEQSAKIDDNAFQTFLTFGGGDMAKILPEVEMAGRGLNEATAKRWKLTQVASEDYIRNNIPGVSIRGQIDNPVKYNNLPVFKVFAPQQFDGDTEEKFVSLAYSKEQGYYLKVWDQDNPTQWNPVDIVKPVSTKSQEMDTIRSYDFVKLPNNEFATVNYSSLSREIQGVIDRAIDQASAGSNDRFTYWPTKLAVYGKDMELPPISKILNIPLIKLQGMPLELERRRKYLEQANGRSPRDIGYSSGIQE